MRRGRPVLLLWRLLNPLVVPLAGLAPWWLLVETTGRRTGRRRLTPLALGRREGADLWVIAVHGRRSGWVLNAEAAGTVRVRHRGRWAPATVHVHPWDDGRVAAMSRYARSGPLLTAEDPLLVELRRA